MVTILTVLAIKYYTHNITGPREAAGIVDYALKLLEEAGVPPVIPEITKPSVFEDVCGSSGKVCVLLFVPHILDSGATGRNNYLNVLSEAAKTFRGQPLSFGWTEAGKLLSALLQ